MERPDVPVIPPDAPWLTSPEVQAVCRAVAGRDGAVYFVGGCVRDALLGRKGGDVDLATDRLPQEVMDRAKAAGLKAIPTGIDHGTVTIVAGAESLEVTTFRKDVATDGRRATVAFSTDMVGDARRRDFTLNALYAAPDGSLHDPLGTGVEDCFAGRIRFIEDANRRIREDYLRVLRFFRFHAWYAGPDAGFDAEALDAIARNTEGLSRLSGERVGAEMLRLLAAPDPAPAMAGLQQTGALAHLLPRAELSFLGPVVESETILGLTADPLRRLAALGGEDVVRRLRLSRKQADQLETLSRTAWGAQGLQEIAYRDGLPVALSAAALRAAMGSQPPDPTEIPALESAANQVFPVKAVDLMPAYEGPALGALLRALEAQWIASGFALSREDLINLP